MLNDKKVFAIVLAAGSATRYTQQDASADKYQPKQFDLLSGKPVICYSLESFAKCDLVDGIVLVVPQDIADSDKLQKLLLPDMHQQVYSKILSVVAGGADRIASTNNGLVALAGEDDSSLVLIHDAARPLISAQIIKECVTAFIDYEGVAVAMPLNNTLGFAEQNNQSEAKKLAKTLPRANYFSMQTPQGFSLKLLSQAFASLNRDEAARENLTDDCSIVLSYKPDADIHLVMGERANMKITYPEDIKILETLLIDLAD